MTHDTNASEVPTGHDLVLAARAFAMKAHEGQERKYTGEPYFVHCDEVAWILKAAGERDEVVAAGFLHDTKEDCGVTHEELVSRFGEEVARLVDEMTDVSKPSDGNRAVRKGLDRAHTAASSRDAKTVKLADIISNSATIEKHDKDFAKVWLAEKKLLLDVLSEGNPELYKRAKEQVVG